MALRILWVKSGPLYPLDSGGKMRSHSMLRELAKSHEVTYLALAEKGASSISEEEAAAPYATKKCWVPAEPRSKRSGFSFLLSLVRNLCATSLPYSLDRYRNSALESELRDLCVPDRFDLVVCDFLTPAPAFLTFDKSGGCPVPAVLFQHNMEAQIWDRLADGKSNPFARFYFRIQAKRMARWEKRLSARFDGVVTVSPDDSDHARTVYGLTNVLGHVPTGVDSEFFSKVTPAGDGHTVGFLGSMDWMPNIEAVLWFAENIFPTIRKSIPDFQLTIIGRDPSPAVARLASTPGIEVTGTVDDVRPYLAKCDALAVPLLSGGGTRIKIMESLAAGIPVISTAVGAEGLGLKNGEHFVQADAADAFAQAVVDLLADPAKRVALSESGRQLVREFHGWEGVTHRFLDLCSPVLNRQP